MNTRVHIAGIGGTFMTGLALLARERGFDVHGSDQAIYPPMSTLLSTEQIPVTGGYEPESLLPHTDMCVIGNALSRGNPLIEHILEHRIPYTSGSSWLRESLIPTRKVLAVAGTHGKTTTSSMAAFIMDYCGASPGFLIGGIPGNFPVSARLGERDWFVIEADEYDTAFFDKRSKFIHYRPDVLLMGNLEFDHADIFSSLEDIKRQFAHLLRSVPPNGSVVINTDDLNLRDVLEQGCWSKIVEFSCQDESCEWFVQAITEDASEFDVYQSGRLLGRVTWPLFGEHNMMNALGAIVSCSQAGIKPLEACKCLSGFELPKRRLEQLNSKGSIALFDDFAHHPTAIKSTLKSIQAAAPGKRVIAVIEPRSNTMKLGSQQDLLSKALVHCDVAVIYRRPDLSWDPATLALHSPQTKLLALDSVDAIRDAVVKEARIGDQVVMMTNGNFDGLKDLLQKDLA